MPNATEGDTSQNAGALSADDVSKLVAQTVNAAVTSHLKRIVPDLTKQVAEAVSSSFSPKLEELAAKFSEAPATGKSSGEARIEDHPAFKGLQKQLADQQKAIASATAERDAERAKARESQLRTRLAEALTAAGVDPARVKHAAGFLVDAEKRVRLSDDGEPVFRDGDADVDLVTGVKAWAKSDDAKIYLPPRGTQGSGDRAGGRPVTSSGKGPDVTSAFGALADHLFHG